MSQGLCESGPGNSQGDEGRSPENPCVCTEIPDITGKAPIEFIGFGLSSLEKQLGR